MTEYKENVWYGWNGGECPVHPRTEVEAVFQAPDNSTFGAATQKVAGHIVWDAEAFEIIAFRVVKEYREPREMWQLLDRDGEVFDTFTDLDDAKHDLRQYPKFTLVHYREVVEGGAK